MKFQSEQLSNVDITPNLISTSKTHSTIYQNGSKSKLVIIQLECNTHSSGSTSTAYGNLLVEDINPPLNIASYFGIQSGILDEVVNSFGQIIFIIPPYFYYELEKQEAGAGTLSLISWSECDLF